MERSYKTDAEESYRGKTFHNKKDLTRKLKRWEQEYNEDRPHLALKGKNMNTILSRGLYFFLQSVHGL